MITSTKITVVAAFTSLLTCAILALPNSVQAADAAADFSSTLNPNGVWSYGWSYGVGGTFYADPISTNSYGGTSVSGWLGDPNSNDGHPFVLKNSTASPITVAFTTFQPGQLAEEGGQSNRVSIVRWTAPTGGSFNIAATFTGLSALGDSSDVHILVNGSSIFSGNVGSPANFSGSQSVLAGSTIDFIVGNGGNGANEDITGLAATVTVPEPSTVGLVGMSIAGLFALGFRKRK